MNECSSDDTIGNRIDAYTQRSSFTNEVSGLAAVILCVKAVEGGGENEMKTRSCLQT